MKKLNWMVLTLSALTVLMGFSVLATTVGAQQRVIGPGFAEIPASTGFGLTGAAVYPRCGVATGGGFGLVDLNTPQTTDRVVDIGLDRQSFLSRGWSEEDLGRWNNGSKRERRGLFLSMFYALQMNNANDLSHSWNEAAHDWDRGLGAHIDYWAKAERHLPFYLYVYDNPNSPSRKGIIVGRNSGEIPFSSGRPCSGANVIGCVEGSDIIYLRADYSWALGHRIDEPIWIKGTDERFRFNITYLIAHEAGHFFGFPHVEDDGSIMNPVIGPDPNKRPRWQVPDSQMRPLFAALARKLKRE
jgi:hypothetical protein